GPELSQHLTRDCADRDPRGGFPGAGTLQDVADIVVPVFHRPRQVGVTRTRTRDGGAFLARRSFGSFRLDVHRSLPVFPILVADHQGDGRAGCPTVTHAAQRLGAIALDGHAAAAAVAALTPAELRGDCVEVDRKT